MTKSSTNENRNSMPIIAAVVDDIRAVFGKIKVQFASENGIEKGRDDSDEIVKLNPIYEEMVFKKRRGG